MIVTTDPRTGVTSDTGLVADSTESVRVKVLAAMDAAEPWERLGRTSRADVLDAIAAGLDHNGDELVDLATRETGLATSRLSGELARASNQFRFFGDVLRDGAYLEVAIDHGDADSAPPVPEVRRMLVPLGPVAVFGASNFPFAFSVPGGDTASALAAGCPVVVKAHPSHPLTSARCAEILREAVLSQGGRASAVQIVYGQAAGAALVAEPEITAVGFTGSLRAGRALLEIVQRRNDPIPFYGELSSINPLVVTETAASTAARTIAEGLFASVTGSGGQFCTKPGIALIPSGEPGDRLVERLLELTETAESQVLLNAGIQASFGEISNHLLQHATILARGHAGGDGFSVAPAVLGASARSFSASLAEECFGPVVIVVRYDGLDECGQVLRKLPPSLAGAIHAEDSDAAVTDAIVSMLRPRVGRLVFNGFPNGVRVSWAQHHGGPWPATNSLHTSVGASAIRRFLRPLAWQDAPAGLLPHELRDDDTGVPARVDGRMTLPN